MIEVNNNASVRKLFFTPDAAFRMATRTDRDFLRRQDRRAAGAKRKDCRIPVIPGVNGCASAASCRAISSHNQRRSTHFLERPQLNRQINTEGIKLLADADIAVDINLTKLTTYPRQYAISHDLREEKILASVFYRQRQIGAVDKVIEWSPGKCRHQLDK